MLLQRQVILQIGTEGSTGKEFRGFRMRFRVDMTRDSTPDKAVLEAWNLAPDTIALLREPDCIVRLIAGYDVPLQIFRGNPVRGGVSVESNPPDRVIRIEAQDGQRQWESASLDASFATDTTSGQVFDALTEALGLPVGTVRLDRSVILSQGLVTSGPVRDALDTLCASQGLRWWVRDGVLQVAADDETTGESAVVFSSSGGNLIGSPVRTDTGVDVEALLAPSLRPGKPFRVESEEVSGDYIASDVSFVGDSGWEMPFYVQASGVPL